MGITGWVIVAVAALLLLYFIAIYNRLVRLRALLKQAFSGITYADWQIVVARELPIKATRLRIGAKCALV